MRRHRWPALAPPTTGGIAVHAAMPIVAEKDLTLELSAATAFAAGLLLRFALCVTGVRADLVRYETRPLTNALDWSAQWSYLAVCILSDDLGGPADPFHSIPEPDPEGSGPYRTTPQHWIGTYPTTGSLTVITSWPQVGLHPTSFTLTLGPSPFPTTFGSDAHR
ncbi:hypothetical protein CJ179_34755 [Rhodococcus sp. ACS1]|uniref:hypothetical protein n=1 Tax=Rhodococcus sp. ACS1 TaxID=2028570 RepID=UPI000BB0DD34|nr:hypothetical protein [Rhodococcus sp. ACS1]PBC39231.1 hypothetical protein CJ179_34755 [Rhodococcus sp. ACS1]